MGAAVAAILIKERRVVEAFERAGAITPARGMTPSDVGVEPYGVGWRRLHERAVVRETTPGSGLYYLDVEVWQAQRRMRRRVLLMVLIIAVALALVAYFGGLR
jgi:hypothetical protein